MKNLFMIKIGGSAGLSNIEVHDIQFILADCIEETFDELKRRWFGKTNSLHIDGYKIISNIDNYSITISKQKQSQTKRLFYIYFGGYSNKTFGEIHENLFLLAEDISMARNEAYKTIKNYSNINHIDFICDVEDNLNLNNKENISLDFKSFLVKYNDLADWQGYLKVE